MRPSTSSAGDSYILEIAVFNVESALKAAQAGADRIELCENPADGGTTASWGTLVLVREQVPLPVFPIIRPRGGDFLYTINEFEVMKKDIRLCKELGFDGIVTGLLLPDGSVDVERTSILVELAYPMEVTFHRAFDRAKDAMQAMEEIITCGCQRILTSGQRPNAVDSRELIHQLVRRSDSRIIIMPGSGVRASNIREIREKTGAVEFHSSARVLTEGKMEFKQASMEEKLEYYLPDLDEIRNMKQGLYA